MGMRLSFRRSDTADSSKVRGGAADSTVSGHRTISVRSSAACWSLRDLLLGAVDTGEVVDVSPIFLDFSSRIFGAFFFALPG